MSEWRKTIACDLKIGLMEEQRESIYRIVNVINRYIVYIIGYVGAYH